MRSVRVSFWIFIFLLQWTKLVMADGLGITPSIELYYDSGDYGRGDTISVYSATISLDYDYSSRLSFSLSWMPYVYQNENYTDIVLIGKRIIHHKDRYGYNPHQPEKTFNKKYEGEYSSVFSSGHYIDEQTGHTTDQNNHDYTENSSGNTEIHHNVDSNTDGHETDWNTNHDSNHSTNIGTSDDKEGYPSQENTGTIINGNDGTNTYVKKDTDKKENKDKMQKMARFSYSSKKSDPISDQDNQEETLPEKRKYRRKGSQSGIGDMNFKVFYTFIEQSEFLPNMQFEAGVKIPLADEDKGLGTGEFDYLLGLNTSKYIYGWVLSAGFSYNFLGDPDYYDLNNYLSGYVCISTSLFSSLDLSIELDAAEAASDESDSELSIGLELGYYIQKTGYIAAGFSKGIENGSPDYSAYVSYSISF